MSISKQIEEYKLKCCLLGIKPLKIYQKNGLLMAEHSDLRAIDCIVPNFITGIGNFAFSDCRELVHIVLPKSLREIHIGAFSGCSSLKEITIPTNVKIIKEDAFQMCIGLEVLNIESDEIVIHKQAFYGCKKLKQINIRGGKINIKSNAFYGCHIDQVHIDCDSLRLGDNVLHDCYKVIAPKRLESSLIYYNGILELY